MQARWSARESVSSRGCQSTAPLIALVLREHRLGLRGALAPWGFDVAVLELSVKAFSQNMSVAVLVMGYFLGNPLPLRGAFWIPTVPGIVGYVKLRCTVWNWRAADHDGARV
jgi:hypothetical protein